MDNETNEEARNNDKQESDDFVGGGGWAGGHGHEARMLAFQQDGTTQATVCPGGKQALTLQAAQDNPFTWVILSGQEAEWLKFRAQ